MVEQTKKCTKCGERKPRDEFYKHKRMKDGRASACMVCMIAAEKTRAEAKRSKTLVCRGCKLPKPRAGFRSIGRQGRRCADCAPEAIANVRTPRCIVCDERHPVASYVEGVRRFRTCAGCRCNAERAEKILPHFRTEQAPRRLPHDPEPRTLREFRRRCADDEAKTAAAVDRLRANTLEALGR